jgi:hypothetical protein
MMLPSSGLHFHPDDGGRKVPPERWYPTTALNSVTTQKTMSVHDYFIPPYIRLSFVIRLIIN